MKFNRLFILLVLFVASQIVNAQSKFSLMPGLYYNGPTLLLEDAVQGVGLAIGVEYMPRQNHFFSIELRSRYGAYFFDDKTDWVLNEDRILVPGKASLHYKLFNPTIGVVPRLYIYLDEYEIHSLFLENEIAVGLMMGNFEYNGQPYAKKSFTEPTFSYIICAGVRVKGGGNMLVDISVGFSTLNFRNNIIKHQPRNYQGRIPNQDTFLIANMIFRFPLGKM